MVGGDGLTVTVTDNVLVESNTLGIVVETYLAQPDMNGSELIVSGGAVIQRHPGRGVAVGAGWNLTMTDDAQVLNNGGGIEGWFSGMPALPAIVVISGNVLVQGNDAGFASGGGLYVQGGPPDAVTITDHVRIVGNDAERGGGVEIHGVGLAVHGNAVIANNTARTEGGGVLYDTQTDPALPLTISGSSVIRDNTAQLRGGVGLLGSAMIISGSALITGNLAEVGGGVALLQLGLPNSVTVEAGSLITWNMAVEGGGVASLNSSGTDTLTAAPGTITDNSPDNCAGYISC